MYLQQVANANLDGDVDVDVDGDAEVGIEVASRTNSASKCFETSLCAVARCASVIDTSDRNL